MRRADARNGIRHPNCWNCSSVSTAWTVKNALVASSMPAADPICVNEPNSPRRPTGACSTERRAEPPHSAPADRPWKMRRTTSPAAAHQPIASKVGMRPMSVEAIPIVSSEATSSAFRPTRSPR